MATLRPSTGRFRSSPGGVPPATTRPPRTMQRGDIRPPVSPPAARALRAATLPRRRRAAWLRIFVVGCSLPCDPPAGGHSCNGGMIPRFHRAVHSVPWLKLAFCARGVLIGSAASIPITHLTPFNQHRLILCRPYFLTRDKNAKLIKESGDGWRARACENAGKCWACGQPNNHSAAALHLVPRGRPQV